MSEAEPRRHTDQSDWQFEWRRQGPGEAEGQLNRLHPSPSPTDCEWSVEAALNGRVRDGSLLCLAGRATVFILQSLYETALSLSYIPPPQSLSLPGSIREPQWRPSNVGGRTPRP